MMPFSAPLSVRGTYLWELPELERRIDADLSGVFKDVSCDRFAVDGVLCHTVLIDAHRSQHC